MDMQETQQTPEIDPNIKIMTNNVVASTVPEQPNDQEGLAASPISKTPELQQENIGSPKMQRKGNMSILDQIVSVDEIDECRGQPDSALSKEKQYNNEDIRNV